MEDFQAFNIRSIPWKKNAIADALATSASALSTMEWTKLSRFLVELVVVPSILDNITNFQVFQDDQHILEFVLSSQMFEGQIIDVEPNGDKEKGDPNEEEETTDDDGIWNLKKNTIPRGMVELERMFDNDESAK